MPYLNWKDQAGLSQEIGPSSGADASPSAQRAIHEASRQRMRLAFSKAHVESHLLPLLREIFAGGGELRLDLPREWIVFWKRREGDSRLLLAHPQEGEWVATIALSADDADELVRRLADLEAGQSVALKDWVAPGQVSNLELELSCR